MGKSKGFIMIKIILVAFAFVFIILMLIWAVILNIKFIIEEGHGLVLAIITGITLIVLIVFYLHDLYE